MTPTRKGLYTECKSCVFYIDSDYIKYPCSYSHNSVRKASGQKYERDFKSCGLKIENTDFIKPKRIPDIYDKNKYIQEEHDMIIAKGGDGTLIRAIHLFKNSKPYYGIAAGTENFLMNKEELPVRVPFIQNLYLIEVKVLYIDNETNELKEDIEYAFNDAIIGEFNAWIEFNCKDIDNVLGNFKGSGVLISTAQGSTGANRNNNGTILPLSSKNWVVTGLMVNRNINYVLEPNEIVINVKSRGNIQINIDGSHYTRNNIQKVTLNKGYSIQVLFNDIQRFKEKRQQN